MTILIIVFVVVIILEGVFLGKKIHDLSVEKDLNDALCSSYIKVNNKITTINYHINVKKEMLGNSGMEVLYIDGQPNYFPTDVEARETLYCILFAGLKEKIMQNVEILREETCDGSWEYNATLRVLKKEKED